MRSFFEAINTKEEDKFFVEFPNAGDHVIGSPLKAQNTEEVFDAVYAFGDKYFSVVED